MTISEFTFLKAKPVWKQGDERVMNQTLEFFADVEGDKALTLYVTGCSSYVVSVGDRFVAHGPARAAHGFYKVDELPLGDYVTEGINRITIRAVGYNVNSFCYLDAPSFLCAELRVGDTVVAATGHDFAAAEDTRRVVKVPRYSYQRTFAEVYRLNSDTVVTGVPVTLAETAPKRCIPRDVPYGDYARIRPQGIYRTGTIAYSEKEEYYTERYIHGVGKDGYKGYLLHEQDYPVHIAYGKMDFSAPTAVDCSTDTVTLAADSYVDMDMGSNYAGLFCFEVECAASGTLVISYDELLVDGTLDPFRLETINAFTVELQAGRYRVVSAEPYVMKHVRLSAIGTDITVRDFSLIEIAYPQSRITFDYRSDDAVLNRIYDAALLTFRTNVADIYMDCASRERAGWLCDSFYIGRAERLFTGQSTVEKAYLRTFLMPDRFEHLPHGMLPMCYPADVIKGEFIPNWAMWYALHLYEYYEHTGDRELVEDARTRMMELLAYFRTFENEYGLLENLDGWIFVEWSKANDLVRDVSFPSNMMYAAFKSILGTLYDDATLLEEAAALRRTVTEMAMTDSGFFCDNAVRKDGKLVLTGERTEVCQYYAFWLGCATPETHPTLWKTLVDDFGFKRKETGKYPEIYPANAFMGNYIRLDLLLKYGYTDELRENIKGFFTHMADTTGSLWEHMSPAASCSHGFASYVVCWMNALPH